jgi:SNF2 family DNA or RNA helicase
MPQLRIGTTPGGAAESEVFLHHVRVFLADHRLGSCEGGMTSLWPHQQAALDFIADKPAAMLAMAMRTGKSRVAIEHLNRTRARRVLILCPKSVVNVWPQQFREYGALGMKTLPLAGRSVAQRQAEAAEWLGHRGWGTVIINYDSVWRAPFANWAMRQHWDVLICDESHRLKAPGGMASRFVARLAQQIPMRLALTGTPMPHSPLDIYAQYRILDSSIFGTSYQRMKHRYAIYKPVQNFELLVGYQNLEELNQKFYAIAYRVGPEVLNLPESLHMTRTCVMAPAGQRVYKELESQFYAQVEQGEITAANAMVKGLRLQQATSGFGKLADSGEEVQVDTAKQKLLEDLLEDLDEPVAVFCRFKHDLAAVHKVAANLCRRSLELSGSRNELAAWQSGTAPILAVQTQAGGVGIDLSLAKVAIYYSLGMSLGDHEQSQYRFLAKDQQHSMAYYYLLIENSVDCKVYNALRARKDVLEAILQR